MSFILDASVAMRWALLDGSSQDREYADSILTSLTESRAVVPPLWHIEIVSVLRNTAQSAKRMQRGFCSGRRACLLSPMMPSLQQLVWPLPP